MIPHVALQRFNEEADILAESVVHHQDYSSKVGPKTVLEYARRAMSGMLYSKGACIVSRSSCGLERSMPLGANASQLRCEGGIGWLVAGGIPNPI